MKCESGVENAGSVAWFGAQGAVEPHSEAMLYIWLRYLRASSPGQIAIIILPHRIILRLLFCRCLVFWPNGQSFFAILKR